MTPNSELTHFVPILLSNIRRNVVRSAFNTQTKANYYEINWPIITYILKTIKGTKSALLFTQVASNCANLLEQKRTF